MIKEKIELVGGVEIAEDVQKKIKAVGVRGMDIEKAKELGFFQRVSNLLCASHVSIMAAYRIYGGAASLINEFGVRRNDIAKAMNDFEKVFMKFVAFWTDYYASGGAGKEINEGMENLYHRIMEWAQLPEQWELGDQQRLEQSIDVAIRIEEDSDHNTLYFKTTEVDSEIIGEIKDSWCVTKYNIKNHKQTTVNADMDKASAMMVAKRLSNEDPDNIYTASMVQDVTERKTKVTPFRAYQANETVGKLTNIEK